MASGLAARNGGRLGLAALVAIVLLGLGLRVGYAWDGRAPVYDAQAYAAIAANLSTGEGFTVGPDATQPSSNYSPGLPLLVAGLYELGGGVDERTARVVLALLASLAVPFTYLIGRKLACPPDRPPRLSEVADREGARGREADLMDRPGYRPENRSSVVAGLVGALVVAVYPALLEYGGMLMSEPMAAALLAGAVLAMLWARDAAWDPDRGGAGKRWLLAGLLLGALALVRPEYLGVGVLLSSTALAAAATPPNRVTAPLNRVTFVAQRATNVKGSGVASESGVPSGPGVASGSGVASRSGVASEPGVAGGAEGAQRWRRGLVAAGLVLVGMAIVIVPWTVRNAVALDRFVPISTGGGQVLFAGTYLPSDGNPERVGAAVVGENPRLFAPQDAERLRLEQILARLAADRYPDLETDQALARMGREQLWEDVTGEPLEYAGFVAAKVGRVWSHGPREVMRQPGWEAFHWALLGLGLLGLAVLAWRRRWEALVIATVFVSITAISALLVASPRRVLVMLPLLAACAGFGAVWLGTQIWKVGLRPSQKRSSYSPASTA